MCIFDALEENGSDEPKQTPSALSYRRGVMCSVWQMQAPLSLDVAKMNTFSFSALKASRASNDIHFIFSVHSSAAVERESCLRVKRLQYECMHAQVRHVQINMYDSTAVGFLLCMLMILYKFNNASVVHRGGGGGGGGGADTTKIGPADPHKSSFRPPEW